jgi:hypothetical protein
LPCDIIAIANDCTIEVERAVVDTEPADRRSDDRASGSTSI